MHEDGLAIDLDLEVTMDAHRSHKMRKKQQASAPMRQNKTMSASAVSIVVM